MHKLNVFAYVKTKYMSYFTNRKGSVQATKKKRHTTSIKDLENGMPHRWKK